MAAATFAARLRRAILAYESQIGRRVPYAELARLFAKAEGRKRPYATATVSEWVQGRSEPKLATIEAVASVLRVPVALLAFGEPDESDGRVTVNPPTPPTVISPARPARKRGA